MVSESPGAVVKSSIQRQTVRGGRISIHTRIKARNLYLVQGLPHKAIAAETGLTPQAIMSLAHREGWVDLRKQAEARAVKKSDAQAMAIESEILDHAVGLAGQHAIQALNNTGKALDRSDRDAARDSQSYSATAKNLVSIMREIRRPDSDTQNQPGGVNVFVLRVGDQVAAKPDPVDAAKQVVEIEKSSVALTKATSP